MALTDLKFNCSSLFHLMTEPKTKSEIYSEGFKTHGVDKYISFMFGRNEELEGKYLEKGNEREEDAISLFSQQSKRFYQKNTRRLEDDFISGEPDLFDGEDILRAEQIFDTKVSWSMYTFMRSAMKPLAPVYYWQGQGYMRLTGAKKHTVVYCLVNGTAAHIESEKKYLGFRYDPESEKYKRKCRQIEINHIFDMKEFMKENPRFIFHNHVSDWKHDVPAKTRIFKQEIQRNEDDIAKIENKVKLARQFIEDNLLNVFTK